jgi:hypothetical protein
MADNSVGTNATRLLPGIAAALALALALSVVVAAQEWPVLQQGMWEIVRTLSTPGGGAPRTITAKRCMDPSEEWKRQNATMAKAGCTATPIKRSGNTYTFSANCAIAGVATSTTTTIVVESPTAYTMKVVGTTGGEPVNEEAKGRRVGDCTR